MVRRAKALRSRHLRSSAFAKSRKALDNAYRGYKELNLRCMKLVEPGGFLVSCSCSQFMTPELFFLHAPRSCA